MNKQKVLEINNVSAAYGMKHIIADINLTLNMGDIVAIVGESGCGKSTLLRAVLSLPNDSMTVEGELLYKGNPVRVRSKSGAKPMLGTEIGMIYQNPWASFNPIRTYRKQFTEMLKAHSLYKGNESLKEILDCFTKLSLPDPERILASCPFELSGGMNQRVAIASALLLCPKLLLLDEPTSALDVTTQRIVVEELQHLHEITGMTMLLVTHNLGMASKLANRIAVMYGGRIVEYGEAKSLLDSPVHPYTKSLIAAVPKLDGSRPVGIGGQPPLYAAEKNSCAFMERCPVRCDGCTVWQYSLHSLGNGRACACRRCEHES